MHHQDVGLRRQHHDRDEVGEKIEIEVGVARVDGVAHGAEQQRVAVLGGAGDEARCDVAAGAGAVLDHELLAEQAAERLGNDARRDIA